jgi:hypothetical protein
MVTNGGTRPRIKQVVAKEYVEVAIVRLIKNYHPSVNDYIKEYF